MPPINCHVPPGLVLFRSRSGKKGDNVLAKRRIIENVFNAKESVSGIEIGKYGLDIRGVSPVIIDGEFYGTVEVVYPISLLIEELNPEDYEAFSLIVPEKYTHKITMIDSIANSTQLIEDNVVLQSTANIEFENLQTAYTQMTEAETDNIVLGKSYNHTFIDVKDFEGNKIAILAYQMNKSDFTNNMNASSYSLFFIGIMIFLMASLILFVVLNKVVINPIKRVTHALRNLALGIVAEKVEVSAKDEIAEMQTALNVVNEGIQNMSAFAIEIGDENYETEFSALSEKDELGNTLIQVRDKLKDVSVQETLQIKLEKQRNWAIEGQSKFAALLQDNEKNIEEYTYSILSNLISYLDINQGAIFLLADDKKTLIMSSSYAYDRRKFFEKEILVGEGLLGDTAKERKQTYITDLPSDYINITSGLGDATPRSLLIVPMVDNDELIGVFELASFRTLEPFELEFCEKIAENIAQSISRQQTNQKTKELLEQSQQQSEELSAQEEEMRQNLEEMQATQEEMARKESKMTSVVNALNSSSLLVEFDLEANIISANDKILKVFGFNSLNEITGRNHQDFYNSEGYQEKAGQLWSALKNKETISRKANIILPNGNQVWLNETYSPVLDEQGEVVKVLNISFDITEEVIAEQRIAQQTEEMQAQEEEMRQNLEEMQSQEEEMLQNFEEMQATQEEFSRRELESNTILKIVQSTVLYAEFTTEKIISNINDNFVDLFGLKKEQMIGQSHDAFGQYSDNAKKYDRMWKKVLKGESVNLRSEFSYNGRVFNIEETYSPVTTEEEIVMKIINISVLRSYKEVGNLDLN